MHKENKNQVDTKPCSYCEETGKLIFAKKSTGITCGACNGKGRVKIMVVK